jgi:hypothetical protein
MPLLVSGQIRKGIIDVPNKETPFGTLLPAGTLVKLTDSVQMYELLVKFNDTCTMEDVFSSDTNYRYFPRKQNINPGTGLQVDGIPPNQIISITNNSLGDSTWTRKGTNTVLRNNDDWIGIRTQTPTTQITLSGNMAYIPVIVDSTYVDDGISTSEMARVMIYSDTISSWYDWSFGDGPQIGAGQEGQIITLYSVSTGRLYLRNYDSTNQVAFEMYGGDNITIQYINSTWTELSRQDFEPFSACVAGGGSGTGGVTYVGAAGGTGINVTGSPITGTGILTITNTAPDLPLTFNQGSGISITGTYPGPWTIANSSPSSGGTVTTVGGTSPISVSNPTTTPNISISQASGSTAGYLSSADWNTFNNKLSTVLASANILVGNSSNVATARSLSGDATVNNTGVISLSRDAVDSTNIQNNNVGGDKLFLTGNVQGDIMYFNGIDWVRLPAGDVGKFLRTNGAGANPSWETASTTAGTLTSFSFTNANGFTGTVANPTTTPALTIDQQNASADGVTKGKAAFSATDFNSSSGLITIDYTNGQKVSSGQPGFVQRSGIVTSDAIVLLSGDTANAAMGSGFTIGADETKINHNNLHNYTARRHFTQPQIDTVNSANQGILKADANGVLSPAISGTDYQAPITPASVSAGSNKITLGGSPSNAALQAFSINADETKFNHDNLLNYTARRHFTQPQIDTVNPANQGILKADANGVLSPATAGTDYLITDKYWYNDGTIGSYYTMAPMLNAVSGKTLNQINITRHLFLSRNTSSSYNGAWPPKILTVVGTSRFDSTISYYNVATKSTTPTYALVMDGDDIKKYAWPSAASSLWTASGDDIYNNNSGIVSIRNLSNDASPEYVMTVNPTTGDLSFSNYPNPEGGTVESVGLALPSQFTVTVTPITTGGDLTAMWQDTTANKFFAGPPTGGATKPTFRSIVGVDLAGAVKDSTFLQGTPNKISVDSSGNTYTINNITLDSTFIQGTSNNIRVDSSGNTYTIINITRDSTYIRAGTNITVDSAGNTYTINAAGATGEATSAANVGAGTGIFKNESNDTLYFKTITGGIGTSVATYDANTLQLNVDTNATVQSKPLTTSQMFRKLDKSDTANQVRIWPINAAGDLLIGTGNNTYTRLGIGTLNQVLTSNGTTAEWTDPATGSAHNGLTLGSPARGLNLNYANQILSIDTASTTDTGVIQPESYKQFDSAWRYMIRSVSGTAPLTLSLSNKVLSASISQAGTTTNGWLSSSDWNIFNGKWDVQERSNLSPGSTKISISNGNNAVFGSSAVSVDVDETKVNHNNLLNYTARRHFTQPEIDSVAPENEGILKASSTGKLSAATIGVDYIRPDSLAFVKGSSAIYPRDTTDQFVLGATTAGLSRFRLKYVHTGGTRIGINSEITSSGAGTVYGIYSDISGSGSTNNGIAGYFSSSGLTTNKALITGYGDVTLNVSGGNTGIGTSNPSEKLQVEGNAKISTSVIVGGTTTNTTITDDEITAPRFKITPEGGYAIRMVAGESISAGDVVSTGDLNGQVIKTVSAGGMSLVGVAYNEADSSEAIWVIISGLAQVNFYSEEVPVRGEIATVIIPSDIRVVSQAFAGYENIVGTIIETTGSGGPAWVVVQIQSRNSY